MKYLGVGVWIDCAEIRVGDSIIERIRAGIDRSNFVLALISQHSVNSSWVRRELDVAMTQEISGKQIKVLPVILDNSELPSFLIGKYYADLRKDINYYRCVQDIANTIDLDLELAGLPRVKTIRPYNGSETSDSVHSIGEIYNRLGMLILEFAHNYKTDIDYRLMPEQWRRADDGATYACDTGNYELYEQSLERLDELTAKYKGQGVWALLSPQGIIMRQAVRLFEASAEWGDLEGIWNLGWRYELGEGVEKDREKAILYWKRAAMLGHDGARSKLVSLSVKFTEN